MHQISKNKYYLKNFFLIFFFSSFILIPLFLYGNHDIENYETNHFTLKINLQNFLNQFSFYFDLYGPGTSLPLDSGFLYLFPSFLIFDIKVFFSFIIILSVSIQLIYLKKICKLLKLYPYEFLIFFFIINNVTLCQIFTNDFLKGYFAFSCLAIIYYYYLKFIIQNNELSFLKLFLILCYFILNTHYSLFFVAILSLFILTIINNKIFFILKKKIFYFCLIAFALIISEDFYRLYEQFEDTSETERFILIYEPKHILSGFIFLIKFFVDLLNIQTDVITGFTIQDNAFKAFAGLTFYFSILYSIKLLFSGQSKKVFNLNILFLLFFLLGFFDTRTLTFDLLNHSIYYSFITNLINIIIFGHLLNNLNYKKFSKYILFLCVISQILFYFSNFNFKRNNHETYSYLKINKNYEKSEFYNFFKNFKNENYSKLYLSPKIWNEFRQRPIGKPMLMKTNILFTEANVFNQTDLFEYNLYPFHGFFKNSSKEPLVKSGPYKFQWYINSNYSDINDELFFNLFNINYLFIYKDEINKINFKKFRVLKNFKAYDKEILFLELKDQRKITFNNQIIDLNKCGKNSVYCIIKNYNNFEKNDSIIFKREKLNIYTIKNEDDRTHNFILPFLYDKSWKTNKKDLISINDSLISVNLEPKEELSLYYQNNFRMTLKIVSLISFILFFVITLKKSIIFKN